jgi:hypothetical protein
MACRAIGACLSDQRQLPKGETVVPARWIINSVWPWQPFNTTLRFLVSKSTILFVIELQRPVAWHSTKRDTTKTQQSPAAHTAKPLFLAKSRAKANPRRKSADKMSEEFPLLKVARRVEIHATATVSS